MIQKMKLKKPATVENAGDKETAESLNIRWRGECLDILHKLCCNDANILRTVRLIVVSRLAMADARRYYKAERLSVDQVTKWPNPLFTAREITPFDKLPKALKEHREKYHDSLLTKEYSSEVSALWDKWIKWRDAIIKQAAEAGIDVARDDVAQWAARKSDILYALSQAGVVPMPYKNTEKAKRSA